MIEIKLNVDEIHYGEILAALMPMILEKAQNHAEVNSGLLRLLQGARLLPPSALQAMVDALPEEKKEELVVGLLTVYQEQIAQELTQKAAEEHLSLRISGIEARRTEK